MKTMTETQHYIATERRSFYMKKTILCIGDSNTYGLNPANWERFGYGIRWTSLLADKLRPLNVDIIEEGLCGRTSIYEDPVRPHRALIKNLDLILETNAPVDYVVLMLGTNDCKSAFHASASEITTGVSSLLDVLERFVPASHILLLSPIHLGSRVFEDGFDPEFNRHSVHVSQELASCYRELAQSRGTFFQDASRVAAPSTLDQEHMDASGHAALADLIARTFVRHIFPATSSRSASAGTKHIA